MEFNINFAAVAVCVLFSFILGFVWYAAIFIKPWTKEMGYDPNMRPDKKQMMKGMLLSVIGNFLLSGCSHFTWRVGNIFQTPNRWVRYHLQSTPRCRYGLVFLFRFI